ncbi:b(0,+)-type amino acid transporter 1-like [Macrosteles quadrilineatus]|uniref:b(0,+)-type amino acid transporter 1-like n=1 Tax=Macrosteles quadrilineatus TaxID=74068 RepID=UPI0023E31EF2|nr:b(0,+)-type amino acid transporter 1-like [Macrosteles quadrilineatus]
MLEKKEKCPENGGVGLKREIGLISAVNFLINYIIASGIFITPGKLLAECGSVGMMLTMWVLCGFIAFLSCLPFGELSTVVPKSGSIYIYLHEAFKGFHPFFGGLPSFVYFWVSYIIVMPASAALSAMLFAEYSVIIIRLIWHEDCLRDENACLRAKYFLGGGALVLIGVVNCISVKLYIKSQDILTYIKMSCIVFIIGCGFYMSASGKAKDYDSSFTGTHLSIKRLTQALYFGLYAYDGGWAITGITEELKNPEKNIVFSILIALTISTVTYLCLNLTFLTALTPEQMSDATTVIADFTHEMFGPSGGGIAAGIICLCLLTSIMSNVFYSSRIGYVAAREGHVFEFLCYIHKKLQTPAPAVICQIVLSLIYFFVGGNITLLVDMCGFFMWMSYGITMVALFVLRSKLPDAYRPFRVPSAIPILVGAVSVFLVVESIMIIDIVLLLVFAALVAFIVFVYYIFIYRAFKIESLNKWQKKVQNSLSLVPPAGELKL